MDDLRKPGEEDLTEDWAFLFDGGTTEPPKQPEPDGINWDDYSFNFDAEFGDYVPPAPAAPTAAQQPAAPAAGRFSLDAMRRLHEGQAAAPYAREIPNPAPPVQPSPPIEPSQPVQKPPRRRKKRRPLRLVLSILGALVGLLAVGCLALWLLARMPRTAEPIGARKDGCAAILLAGTDEEGMRTDTLMLLYLDAPHKAMRLLSIPRDTMVNRDNPVPKINGAYGANGWTGDRFDPAKGMDVLMDYVKDVVGYRPDGYVLIDLDCFEELVDLMGGVSFDVPMDMHYEDPAQDLVIDLKQGTQRLSGKQAMWLVRFRSGYAMADLKRIEVQRSFLSSAMHQWASVWKLYKLPFALGLMRRHTTTDLDTLELAWVAKTVAACRGGLESDTLPGTPQTVNGGAYYVENVWDAAALVREKYNPYTVEITADMLHPYGR